MFVTELWDEKRKKELIEANQYIDVLNSEQSGSKIKEYISFFRKIRIDREIKLYQKLLNLRNNIFLKEEENLSFKDRNDKKKATTIIILCNILKKEKKSIGKHS